MNKLSLHDSDNITKNLLSQAVNCTSNKTSPLNNKMPFALNLEAAVDGITKFDIPSDIKLNRRATTKLEEELYYCVPHDLFSLSESLND